METVRVYYRKTGRGKYISHLDITRCMKRALRRAGIPVWYTEGFNPHAYMTFALPISLGFESLCETMDIRLTDPMPFDEIQNRLNRALPEGLTITKVGKPVKTANEIAYSRYVLTARLDGCTGPASCFEQFVAQPQILVEKRTKRGTKEVDLRPDITVKGLREENETLILEVILPSGNEKTVNPTLLLASFAEYAKCPLCFHSVSRTAVYTADFTLFE